MGKTLHDARARAAITERIGRLSPDATPRWGSMTPGAVLCHLADAVRVTLGERRVDPAPIRFRPIIKQLALSPIPFPRGRIRAPAGVDPERDGTAPTDFEDDREQLLAAIERYAQTPLDTTAAGFTVPDPPRLGPLTARHWSFFQYKHTDHHLRQFGV